MTGITPDLMICDIAMPRMNGLKLVEHLRNEGDQMPILVISATEIWRILPKHYVLAFRIFC